MMPGGRKGKYAPWALTWRLAGTQDVVPIITHILLDEDIEAQAAKGRDLPRIAQEEMGRGTEPRSQQSRGCWRWAD